MTLAKRLDIGIVLSVDSTGGTSFTTLGNIVDSFSGPEAKADLVDTTLLGASTHDWTKGAVDGGKVSFTYAYDPDDSNSKLLAGLLTQTTPVPKWKVDYPSSSSDETFSAHLESMGREIAQGKLITCKIGLQCVGSPGYTTS